MSKRLATSLLLSGIILATASCESSQQKEAKRINQLNIENCLMKKEDTIYCDRVDDNLTSEKIMQQVAQQKKLIKDELKVKERISNCLTKSSIQSCYNIDISSVDVDTQDNVAAKIQEIRIDECVNNKNMIYCETINLSSTDKETEDLVLAVINEHEAEQKKKAEAAEAAELNSIIATLSTGKIDAAYENAEDILQIKLKADYQPANDYILTLEKQFINNGDKNASLLLARLSNSGIKQAQDVLARFQSKDASAKKVSRKSRQSALREICEAGAEYSRDSTLR